MVCTAARRCDVHFLPCAAAPVGLGRAAVRSCTITSTRGRNSLHWDLHGAPYRLSAGLKPDSRLEPVSPGGSETIPVMLAPSGPRMSVSTPRPANSSSDGHYHATPGWLPAWPQDPCHLGSSACGLVEYPGRYPLPARFCPQFGQRQSFTVLPRNGRILGLLFKLRSSFVAGHYRFRLVPSARTVPKRRFHSCYRTTPMV